MIGMRAPSESRAHAPEEGDRNAKESEVRPGHCIVRRDRVSAPPAEVLAGPMTAASPLSVGLTAPAEKVYYRRHYGPRRYYGGHYRRGHGGYYSRGYGGYYRRGYYRNYGYDPSGAIFAGAALGLLGAGIAEIGRAHV